MPKTSFAIDKKLFLVEHPIAKKKATKKVVVPPTHHVAIIDCSGSMSSELPQIRKQLKAKLPKLLREKDTFSLIWFSGRGQFGALLEAEPVASLDDLAEVNRAIDRWLTPQGLTGFKEPLEEAAALIGRITRKAGDAAVALFFMSDGGDNVWPRAKIHEAVEQLAPLVHQATIVEYGLYADRSLLTAMAEKAGGQLIYAEDFDRYAPSFEAAMQRRPLTTPRVEIDIDGEPVRGFVWAVGDDETLVTYAVENGKASVPETTTALFYLSSTKVGSKVDEYDAAQAYAALSLYSVRMAPEVVLPLLRLTGDVALIERFGGLFGKQKYSEFMEETRAAVFDEKRRLTRGYDPRKVPADDAFSVLDLLQLMATDHDNHVLLDHPTFHYAHIGRDHIDAAKVLSPEEQAEVADLTARMAKARDASKIADLAKKLAEITSRHEGLTFTADPAPDGYSVTSLTYNEERPNVSFLVRKTGTVDISKAVPKSLAKILPAKFPTFIYRNFTVIKDGLVHIDTLPVKLSEHTLEALFEANREGRLADDVVRVEGDVAFIDFKALPIINRQMIHAVSARALFEEEWAIRKLQAAHKVFATVLKEHGATKHSESFAEKYGDEAAEWLKEQGFTDYSGFNPKRVLAEATDVYKAHEMSVALAGYASLPSLNEFKKQKAKGKLSAAASLLEPYLDEVEAYMATPAGKKQDKLDAWLHARLHDIDVDRRARLANKAQQIFAIIVGQTWPSEFSSIDENSLDIKVDGLVLHGKIETREVDEKISGHGHAHT